MPDVVCYGKCPVNRKSEGRSKQERKECGEPLRRGFRSRAAERARLQRPQRQEKQRGETSRYVYVDCCCSAKTSKTASCQVSTFARSRLIVVVVVVVLLSHILNHLHFPCWFKQPARFDFVVTGWINSIFFVKA